MLAEWSVHCPDLADKGHIEKYFMELFDKFKELREYIYTYTFAIPSHNFTSYSQKLDHFNDLFNQTKDVALPKKKFTFAKKKQNT